MVSEIYRKLRSELNKGRKAVLITLMNCGNGNGDYLHQKVMLTEEQLMNQEFKECPDEIIKRAHSALKTGKLQYINVMDSLHVLIEPYFPEPRLIVLGGGHIAKSLAEFASKVGFLVTVVDDRPMYADKHRFPNADEVICDSYGTCFSQLHLNQYSFVVIVTGGNQQDLECLKQSLNYKTAYIGMIGSKRRVNIIKEQLIQEGYSEECINSINAPIGIDIGAVTPEEIALSIIAQAVKYRRLKEAVSDKGESERANWPELDRTVVNELCNDGDDPKALITVIETRGSAPRKPGAKMIAWSYGKTVGSIGGGYAEGEVNNIAWDVIGSKRFKIYDVDMTGQSADDDGIVCGGIMKVLIEDYNEWEDIQLNRRNSRS